jgi:hypothetical protein
MENYAAPVLPLKITAAVLHLDSTLPGWTLLEPGGEAQRTYTTRVAFENPFRLAPVVHAAISGFDIENSDAARTKVSVGAVDDAGFELRIETWLATRIWSIDVSWLAIGH